MQSNTNSVNTNALAASSSTAGYSGSEDTLRLAKERIEQTQRRVQQNTERLAALRRYQRQFAVRELLLVERCLKQQEALERQRSKLTGEHTRRRF